MIDNARAGVASARRPTDGWPRAAKAASRRRGYLDGRSLAEVFAWLRPGDLIWNYWVNNYLLGKKPPAFDILFWNADTTRMPAGLHADFVDMAMDNQLADRAGALTVLGVPIDLSQIDTDTYVVAGIADHITPWQSCYRTTQLLGGSDPVRPVHQRPHRGLVNPPGNPKASYQVNKDNPADPAEWLMTRRDPAGHLVDRRGRLGWPSAAARPSRRRNSSAAAAFARSSRRPAPTSSTAEGGAHVRDHRPVARHRLLPYRRPAHCRGARLLANRARFRRRRGAACHQRLLGAGRVSAAACREARQAGDRRRRHPGLRLPTDEPDRLRPHPHGAQPR